MKNAAATLVYHQGNAHAHRQSQLACEGEASRFSQATADLKADLDANSKQMPKAVRRYTSKQVHLASQLDDALLPQMPGKEQKYAQFCITFSFAMNVVLLACKITAVALANSLILWTSLADSFLDLLSGSIIFISARMQSKAKPEKYPIGRSQLEALGIMVFSTVMGMTSVQLIVSSITNIASTSQEEGYPDTSVSLSTYIVLLVVVLLKVVSLAVCLPARKHSEACAALVQDHANDTVTNALSLLIVFLAAKYPSAWFIDPMFAILFSLVILIGWMATGYRQLSLLSGLVADPEVIARITWVALHSSPHIKAIDTVVAFHVGTTIITEVDIVLDCSLGIILAHDVAEQLTRDLEQLPEVQRAYVHIDYESEHKRDMEHINKGLGSTPAPVPVGSSSAALPTVFDVPGSSIIVV
eukprot:m.5510 g.5510  ORF g.5510 m.5510 type:complete len:414 (-) comp5024_c0_seq1:194-1435(-)